MLKSPCTKDCEYRSADPSCRDSCPFGWKEYEKKCEELRNSKYKQKQTMQTTASFSKALRIKLVDKKK